MFITRLYLKGYQRLKPSGIQEIDLCFTSVQQVIIGTNGSGKSSILAEASPLPAVARNYDEGGEKLIEFHHMGKHYTCISRFEKKAGTHYFRVDGEVLNNWGTSKVQLQLVKTHFGLDPSLLSLLMGKENFTDYPALKRRQLLMDISGSDFDYAMKVYNALRERTKAQQTIAKHEASRVAAHQQRRVDLGDPKPKEQEIKTLLADIERCYQLSPKRQFQDFATLKQQHDDYPRKIQEHATRVMNQYPAPPSFWGDTKPSLSWIAERINQCAQQMVKFDEGLKEAYDKRASLIEILANSDKVNQLEAITAAKDSMAQRLEQIKQQLGDQDIGPEGAYENFEQIYPRLAKALQALPDNHNHALNAQKHETCVQKSVQARHRLGELHKEQASISTELKHALSKCETVCPQCELAFIPGVGPQDIPNLERKLNHTQRTIEQLEESLGLLDQYIRDYQNFHDMRMKLCASMQGNPMHKRLWEELEPLLMECQDARMFQTVEAYRDRLTLEQQYHSTQKQYQSVYRDWEFTQALASKDLSHSQDQNLQLDQHIANLLTQKEQTKQQHARLCGYLNAMTQWMQDYEVLLHMIEQAAKNAQEGVDHLYRKTLEEHRLSLQLVVSQHQRDLHDLSVVENAVKEAELQLGVAQTRQNIYGGLTKSLSPTEGLIAEHIRGFLNTFVDQINRIIAAVWTYDFRVLACGLDAEELDYKFPLAVESDEATSPDIAECSSSQLDMINFAIRLTIMHFLGLQDHPLYLDELAATMDEQHRINMFRFVHSLVESGRCSQLFMISHYVAGHGGMANAEVLVVSDTNIINMPGVYNQHAKIKRSRT